MQGDQELPQPWGLLVGFHLRSHAYGTSISVHGKASFLVMSSLVATPSRGESQAEQQVLQLGWF